MKGILRFACLALPLALLAGCTHVKGVVLDEAHRPVTDAQFTVGRPTGLGPFARYRVDSHGRFDFTIPATDENWLFVWDGKGDPTLAVRKIDAREISDNMTIILRHGPGEF